MTRIFRPLLALTLFVLWLPSVILAQEVSFQTMAQPEKALVQLGIRFDRSSYQPGEQIHGTVTAAIADGWHINSSTPLNDFSIPTRLDFTSAAMEVSAKSFPEHVERAFAFSGGEKLAVYQGTIEIPFTASRLAADDDSVQVSLFYQACDDQVCLPPKTVSITTRLGEAKSIEGAAGNPPAEGKASGSGDFTPLSAAPPEGTGGGSVFSSDLGATFASHGLLLTLLVVFVLGLALNLTPCVYPLIPITVGYFSSQKEGSRASRIALSVFYVLGIAITYSVLGVTSALSGRLFGAWLQSSAVLIFFALLMLVLAASMFGAYDIRVPQVLASRSGAKAGYAGAMTMGLLAGIVAAPCVGPFVISLIALVAQSGSVGLGFILFFVLALGLGLPYLVLGAFSSTANSMPRSGAWMVQIKKAFGFLLIAMAFYFLRPLVGNEIYRWGVAISLIVGAGFLLLHRGKSPGGNAIRIASGVILLVIGVVFAIPSRKGAELDWKKFDAKAIEAATSSGKPVMIDFYADWCMPCRELDEKTFSHPEVARASERFVRLKADLTRPEDPATRELSKRYGILGVPTIVLIDSSGNEQKAQRLVGFEPPEKFLERLQSVK